MEEGTFDLKKDPMMIKLEDSGMKTQGFIKARTLEASNFFLRFSNYSAKEKIDDAMINIFVKIHHIVEASC